MIIRTPGGIIIPPLDAARLNVFLQRMEAHDFYFEFTEELLTIKSKKYSKAFELKGIHLIQVFSKVNNYTL